MFGRICRRIICREVSPDSRAAATKSLLFNASVWLRATRAYFGQLMTASASTALLTPPPSNAAIARANTSPGKAKQTSEMRIMTESTMPP